MHEHQKANTMSNDNFSDAFGSSTPAEVPGEKPQYDNTNRGSIWKNERKREGKQDADFTGTLNVDGKEYWVNAWRRKDGASARAPALSFSIRAKVNETSADDGIPD